MLYVLGLGVIRKVAFLKVMKELLANLYGINFAVTLSCAEVTVYIGKIAPAETILILTKTSKEAISVLCQLNKTIILFGLIRLTSKMKLEFIFGFYMKFYMKSIPISNISNLNFRSLPFRKLRLSS